MDGTDRLALTELPCELARLTGETPPPYRRCWNRAVDGYLPTEKVNGRHYVLRRNIPAIAAMFDLAKQEQSRPKRRKIAATTSITA